MDELPKVSHGLLEKKRRAYVVLGPEISGTKLLAEILLKCCNLQGRVTDGFLPDEKEDLIMVSPDVGGVVRARAFAKRLETDLAIIDKRRERAGVSEVMHIIGDVKDRTCILVDDIVDLSVARSPITDETLALCSQMPNHERLDVRKTKITDAGVAELKKALPKCQITK